MRAITILIKPASSLCNMRCKYCFYADVAEARQIKSYGIMKETTTDLLIQNVFSSLSSEDEVTFAFQGGEPTLAGLAYFQHFAAQTAKNTSKASIHYSIQTNGLLIDEAWCQFFKEQHFLVGLSLDGPASSHDANRLDADHRGTQKRVFHTLNLLKQFQIPYNILWVLTNQQARHPKQVWDFLEKNQIPFVQFIPCLGSLDDEKSSFQALTPQRFSQFYTELFHLWSDQLFAGSYRSIKFFDDFFHLFLHRQVTACGFTGQCHSQFVVEADGSVYPCDFYVTDSYCIGQIKTDTFETILANPQIQAFTCRPRPQSAFCQNCPYHRICGGGCPRMFHEMYVDQANSFCGYRNFLDTNKDRINQVGAFLIKSGF